MGGEHFGFLIEAGRDGFPEFDDDPRHWGQVIDDIIGRKFACGASREDLAGQYDSLCELLEERGQALGLEEDEIYDKMDELFRPDEKEIFLRGSDCDLYTDVRAIMGIMPYGGKWIQTYEWDIEGLGPRLGYNWDSAMAYAWQLQELSDTLANWALPELLDELQGTEILEAIQEGFKLRPPPDDPGAFRLEIQQEETVQYTANPRPLEKVCCFVPPFLAGFDRIMGGPVFGSRNAHDIRLDPLRPLDSRSAIMFLNVRC